MNSSNTIHISPEIATGAGLLIFGSIIVTFLLVLLLVYIYVAICLSRITKKTNTENAWFAWIPILNLVLMLQIAKKPLWWIIFALIPIVNLIWVVFSILIWMEIAERLKKPTWLGVLMILPFANLFVYGYLAFSESTITSEKNLEEEKIQTSL